MRSTPIWETELAKQCEGERIQNPSGALPVESYPRQHSQGSAQGDLQFVSTLILWNLYTR